MCKRVLSSLSIDRLSGTRSLTVCLYVKTIPAGNEKKKYQNADVEEFVTDRYAVVDKEKGRFLYQYIVIWLDSQNVINPKHQSSAYHRNYLLCCNSRLIKIFLVKEDFCQKKSP